MMVGFAAAFFGGMLTLLSPCSAMLLPGFFAYAFAAKRQLVARTGVFYVGLISTLVPLGIAAGTIGAFLNAHRTVVTAIGGGLLILFGLLYLAGVKIPLPGRRRDTSSSAVGVYLLGAAYGLAGGCTGPILGSILTIAALSGTPGYGGALLAVYAAGMAVPAAALALLWDRLRLGHRRLLHTIPLRIGRWRLTTSQALAGLLFIGIGVLMIASDGTSDLGGVLSAQQDIGIESWLETTQNPILNAVVLGGLAAAATLVILTVLLRPRRTPSTKAPDSQKLLPTPSKERPTRDPAPR